MSKLDRLRELREARYGRAPSKPVVVDKPKRGRPKGDATVPIPARLTPELAARLDAEAKRRGLTRSQAIRVLIEEALR